MAALLERSWADFHQNHAYNHNNTQIVGAFMQDVLERLGCCPGKLGIRTKRDDTGVVISQEGDSPLVVTVRGDHGNLSQRDAMVNLILRMPELLDKFSALSSAVQRVQSLMSLDSDGDYFLCREAEADLQALDRLMNQVAAMPEIRRLAGSAPGAAMPRSKPTSLGM